MSLALYAGIGLIFAVIFAVILSKDEDSTTEAAVLYGAVALVAWTAVVVLVLGLLFVAALTSLED